MVESFEQILARPTIFRGRDVLSPHYLPEVLPHREKEIERIMLGISPALKGERPRNQLLYGKTGTGKTCSVKFVTEKFQAVKSNAKIAYINCRIYNSRYRILQKVVKDFLPEFDKAGYGLSYFYEHILDWVESDGKILIYVLDEVDMVKDIDDLAYTLTRSNDELQKGSVSLIGISNKLSFKEKLDPRSRSSLFETEMVFAPYNSYQLKEILKQRVSKGFAEGAVDEAAVNLAAAIAAQDNGDARYALKLLLKAGELADESGATVVADSHVEQARRSVDEDVSFEAISTLPQHQQIVLCALASLQMEGRSYSRLQGNGGNGNGNGGSNPGYSGLLSGEVYEKYVLLSKKFRTEARSVRWYREYLSDLEMLGLIAMEDSGKGQRGHTRFLRLSYSPEKIIKLVESSVFGEEGVIDA